MGHNSNVQIVKALRDMATGMADILTEMGYLDGENVAVKSKASSTKAKAAAAEVEDDEDTEDEEGESKFSKADLSKKSLAALKKIAVGEGFDPDDLSDATKDEIIDALLEDSGEADEDAEDEDEDTDEESEDEAEDEEGDEDGEYTRDDYDAMSLAEVKAIAKEAGYSVADLKGLDKDAIADLLLGEESEEAEEDEAEDEEPEDDEEVLTEEDLLGMPLAELKAVAKDYEVKVTAGMKKADIVAAIMESGE